MDFWKTTPYAKWYASHRRFSFVAEFCIEHYEEKQRIPSQIFTPFIKSLYCHSKSEEKMFGHIPSIQDTFKEHAEIVTTKQYTDEEKYNFCKALLLHMKEEEDMVFRFLEFHQAGSVRTSPVRALLGDKSLLL